MSGSTPEATRGVGGSVGRISIAIIAGSILSYGVVILTGRLFTPADYAVFMTFWGLLFGLGSALSPLEQELSRQSAVARQRGGKLAADGLTTLYVGLGVAAVAAAVPLLPWVNERLFGEHYGLAVVVFAAGLGFAAQFAVRGVLVGNNEVNAYSLLLLVEAGSRPLIMVGLVLAALDGLITLAVAVAVGSFAWLVVLRPARATLDPTVPGDPAPTILRRMLLLFTSSALTASVITGYPAMVGILAPGGDQDRLGGLYAALAVSRVPLVLFSALQALAIPLVVRLSATAEGVRRLRKLLVLGTLGTVVLALLGALIGWLAGPWVVDLLFGDRYEVPGWAVAGLVWSAVLVAIVQLLAAVLVARVRPGEVLGLWAVVATASAVALLVWPGDTVLKAVVGLVAGPTLGLLVAVVLVLKTEPRDIPVMPDGGTETVPR
ncbi:lipopolysaccharide biosynthesis protein [Actinokineospora globicatena]|uniref:lipopolysaccharide biosynthesis protein n=1 Tax=Actinokineospora globicatena TaxID=103729 RepID=UPI0020A2B030|nr:hypothetical protein [Actinokineospora globicatena]MCP2301113.1 Membrane protein involved in the export of O-antigen and teichoic acid [Actinokineospora globicatena]GLW77251.1 hypothetical protein Aglo01_17330 [Actinokineospora globicatena]GLW84085.1 hypothetical protein Aglo02_17250 [Actinokineospora globicatena]